MGHELLEKLGLVSQSTLEINTLGDEQSRLNYRDALREHFNRHLSSLSGLSRDRLERGSILRILDSKEKEDIPIIQQAPLNTEYLTGKSQQRFASILAALNHLRIPYSINSRLVRGLDYYSETCFEWVSNSTKSAILAGGRYDALVKQMGGPDTPGIGYVVQYCVFSGGPRCLTVVVQLGSWRRAPAAPCRSKARSDAANPCGHICPVRVGFLSGVDSKATSPCA